MLCVYRFYRGCSFFFYHIRGKNDKNQSFYVFIVFTGGRSFFFYHIRGKNGKNRKTNTVCLTFLPRGRSFFFYHIRGKNGKN